MCKVTAPQDRTVAVILLVVECISKSPVAVAEIGRGARKEILFGPQCKQMAGSRRLTTVEVGGACCPWVRFRVTVASHVHRFRPMFQNRVILHSSNRTHSLFMAKTERLARG